MFWIRKKVGFSFKELIFSFVTSRYRICPGQYMASDVLFMTICSILACLNIQQKIDVRTGKPVEVHEDMTSTVVSCVEAF